MARAKGWNPKAKRPGRHNTPAYDRQYYRQHREQLRRAARIRYRMKKHGLSIDQAARLERLRERRGKRYLRVQDTR